MGWRKDHATYGATNGSFSRPGGLRPIVLVVPPT